MEITNFGIAIFNQSEIGFVKLLATFEIFYNTLKRITSLILMLCQRGIHKRLPLHNRRSRRLFATNKRPIAAAYSKSMGKILSRFGAGNEGNFAPVTSAQKYADLYSFPEDSRDLVSAM